MLKDFTQEYERYKTVGQRAIAQVPDDALNKIVGADNNSVAIIVRHISGNFVSRFTDFLTTDGEKPWRDRDAEFEDNLYSREEINELWEKGWRVLENQLAELTDSHLDKQVYIRGQALTVHEALARSLSHVSYHVGQIVLLARILVTDNWNWISVPKGKSKEYNLNPTMEKKPQG